MSEMLQSSADGVEILKAPTKAVQAEISKANSEHAKATDSALNAIEAKQAAMNHAIACGKALIRAKKKAGHGNWEGLFLGSNVASKDGKNATFTFTRKHASRYMKLAAFPTLARQAQLEDKGERFSLDRTYAALSDASAEDEKKAKNDHRIKGTGQNEWHTPEEYIAAAKFVLGGIDLDPASSVIANRTVGAERFFTIDDDGLSIDWHGRVWMNPPYSQPHIKNFSEKLVEQLELGNVEAAIALTHNYTDTAWFRLLANVSEAICFTKGRIGFVSPEGDKAVPTQGQAFFYFGDDFPSFFSAFREIGFIVRVMKNAF